MTVQFKKQLSLAPPLLQNSFLIALTFFFVSFLYAASAHSIEGIASPEIEQKAISIFQQVRCITCAASSIHDSQSPFAQKMRAHVRQQLSEGVTPQKILQDIEAEHGSGVLLSAPKDNVLIIWPIIAIIIAILAYRKLTNIVRLSLNTSLKKP